MLKLSNTYKKAFGLIEVLIVLAIVATTMLAATQVTLTGMRAIKIDEIFDYMNGVLLQGLEISKSPTNVEIVGAVAPANFNGSYRLQTTTGGKAAMILVTTSTTPITIANCSSSSAYFVNIEEASLIQNPAACLQIIVTQRQNLGLNYYEVRSRIVYTLNGQNTEKEIIGYRRNNFTFRVATN